MRVNLDRRSFLRLSGAAAGTVTAGEIFGSRLLDRILPVEAAGSTRIIAAVCNNNCGGRCLIKAHVIDGVIVRITTDDASDSAGRPQ